MKRRVEKALENWKGKGTLRKPLLLNGARQVGKTYILRNFGEQFFRNMVYVNLETNRSAAAIFDENISPERIVRLLEAESGTRVIPEETLLILDEIQSCERALTSLKYFCEEAPQYYVAAAGSLLGVAVNREKFSFPVGMVDILRMYPLDFEEFLLAHGYESLAGEIRLHAESLESLSEGLHEKAMELYREYLLVGGMPSAVKNFLREGSFLEASEVHRGILDSYVADMAKYASAAESVKIRSCYGSIPAQLAKENKKFQYKVVKNGGSASYFGASIEWLEYSGAVLKCTRLEHAYDPIEAYVDLSGFKLYMGDVGLLATMSGISRQAVFGNSESKFVGALAENYVAQQLASRGETLHYWESQGRAELDFVLQNDSEIKGIEVKSGTNVHSRSHSIFCGKYPHTKPIRISLRNFGTDGKLVTLPLYAAHCL